MRTGKHIIKLLVIYKSFNLPATLLNKTILMLRLGSGLAFILCCCFVNIFAQSTDTIYLLKPDRVFDGEQMHTGWQVLIKNNAIAMAGPSVPSTENAIVINLKGCTLLPGLIEGHSHLFLHPYNETTWDEQVLKESDAERVARATVSARNTLSYVKRL